MEPFPFRLNCVILNYNDADTVRKLVSQIHDYPILEGIVVVDNHSSDDSLKRLLPLEDEKVTVLCARKNGGYGFGNNLGVRWAVEHNQATHVLIANPDISVSQACLKGLLALFFAHPQVAAASAVMEDPQGRRMQSGWRLGGCVTELLSMGPISRRLFRPFLNDPDAYFRYGTERKKTMAETAKGTEKTREAVWVDAVHGSMVMVDGKKFLEAGGYDEGIFLYQEEAVLGRRLKRAGYRTMLLLSHTYCHAHSVSISKTFESLIKRQRLREESLLYYMKHYLRIGPLQEAFARIWFWMIRVEIRMASWLGLGK